MTTSTLNSLGPLAKVGSIDEENSLDGEQSQIMHELPDCPICLDQMKEADLRHPLQCNNHCGYNFCRTCIQSLITSSRDDYVEASDGSKQVKIFLHCPNCRSDLSSSIRDTVLLRKAHEAKEDEERQTNLDDSMRYMKKALSDVLVKEAINDARLREIEFFGYHTCSSTESDSSDEDDGDWGVEADLVNGVHQSFHSPRQLSFNFEQHVDRVLLIDHSLLGGLADPMTEYQQEKITGLLTSGDPFKLVEAAELLRGIAEGFNPKQNKDKRRLSSSTGGSVYGLIVEAQKARKKATKNDASPSSSARAKFLHRQMEMELLQQAEYLASHPLPVRMPKAVALNLNERNTLTFVDDIWDGTIDCFDKLSIGFDGCVYKYSQKNHKGVRNILDSDGPVRIDFEKRRVVVLSVQGDCGRQGVLKGDVLTHVNGKPWTGSALALTALFESAALKGDKSIRLAFNCGPAVAEALKRRSLVP